MSIRGARAAAAAVAILCGAALVVVDFGEVPEVIRDFGEVPENAGMAPRGASGAVVPQGEWNLAQTKMHRARALIDLVERTAPVARGSWGGWGFCIKAALCTTFVICVTLSSGGFPMVGSVAPAMWPLRRAGKARRLEASRGVAQHRTYQASTLSAQLSATYAGIVDDDGSEEPSVQHKEAEQVMAGLRGSASVRREVRRIAGEDGLRDDDRDSVQILTFLAEADAQAQTQQYGRAEESYIRSIAKADAWIKNLQQDGSAPGELEEAHQLLGDALSRYTGFLLDRGHTKRALHILEEWAGVCTGKCSWKLQLLSANALRDSGMSRLATKAYQALQKDVDAAASSEQPLKLEFVAEVSAEFSRERLLDGDAMGARQLLTLALASAPPSSSLRVRLQGWLGVAQLQVGSSEVALASFDKAVAGFEELSPPGLGGATPEFLEILQGRARTKVLLGDLSGASQDIATVEQLQEEMWTSASTIHAGEGGSARHPDPRLRGAMARTRLIAADIALGSGDAASAMKLSKAAVRLLRETERAGVELPRSLGVATLLEAENAVAAAQGSQPKAGAPEQPQGGLSRAAPPAAPPGLEAPAEPNHKGDEAQDMAWVAPTGQDFKNLFQKSRQAFQEAQAELDKEDQSASVAKLLTTAAA